MRVKITSSSVDNWFDLGATKLSGPLAAAIASADVDEFGARIFFPPGCYEFEKPLHFGSNVQLLGSGRGSTKLLFVDDCKCRPDPDPDPNCEYRCDCECDCDCNPDCDCVCFCVCVCVRGPKWAAISRDPTLDGSWNHFAIRDLTIESEDYRGGCGLEVVSAMRMHVENVEIRKFRFVLKPDQKPDPCHCPQCTTEQYGDHGLRILNSDYGLCAHNTFSNLIVDSCGVAIVMDSVNSTHSTGYTTFVGTTIFQERDCVILNQTSANGSIDNRFLGLMIQGTPSPGGNYVVIEGRRNHIVNLVLDRTPDADNPTRDIWFRKSKAGHSVEDNRVSGTGLYRLSRVTDGGPPTGDSNVNTIDGPATFRGGDTRTWYFKPKVTLWARLWSRFR